MMMTRSRVWLGVLAVILATVLGGSRAAQAQSGRPVKLYVLGPRTDVYVGVESKMQVILRDASNTDVRATKDYPVEVEWRYIGGKFQKIPDGKIRNGDLSTTFTLSFPRQGFVEIRATNSELRDGATVVRVIAKTGQTPGRSPEVARLSLTMMSSLHLEPALFAQQPAGTGEEILIWIPASKTLANGKDSASIKVFLTQAAHQDILVFFEPSTGSVRPNPLVIRAGTTGGESQWFSTDAGPASFRSVFSIPRRKIQPESTVKTVFDAPIMGMRLVPNPPRISLADRVEVQIHLVDENGYDMPDFRSRPVTLAVIGPGRLNSTVEIPAHESVGKAVFIPEWPGRVDILATSANLGKAKLSDNSDTPAIAVSWSLLIPIIVGGAVGGCIAFWTHRKARWWRIPVGMVTGFVLWWMALVGLLPRVLALSPTVNIITGFVVSVAGGWLGIAVLEALVRLLELPVKKQGRTTIAH